MDTTINLGDVAKDSITGYTGVTICRDEWLNGCVRFTLQSQKLINGKPVERETFDEPQLVLVSRGKRKPVDTGGPRPEPRQPRPPSR